MSARVTKYEKQLVTRVSAAQMAALEVDATQHGRTVAQSARFAIDLYLAATPPVTVRTKDANPEGRCPDGGFCHHDCGSQCFRVSTCGPLSGVFPGDRWPGVLTAEVTVPPRGDTENRG